jgi:hypothetical protein
MAYQNINQRTRGPNGQTNTGGVRYQNLYAMNKGQADNEMSQNANAATSQAKQQTDSGIASANSVDLSYKGDGYSGFDPTHNAQQATDNGAREKAQQEVSSAASNVDQTKQSKDYMQSQAGMQSNLQQSNKYIAPNQAVTAAWYSGAGQSNPIVASMNKQFSNLKGMLNDTGMLVDSRSANEKERFVGDSRLAAQKEFASAVGGNGWEDAGQRVAAQVKGLFGNSGTAGLSLSSALPMQQGELGNLTNGIGQIEAASKSGNYDQLYKAIADFRGPFLSQIARAKNEIWRQQSSGSSDNAKIQRLQDFISNGEALAAKLKMGTMSTQQTSAANANYNYTPEEMESYGTHEVVAGTKSGGDYY